MKQSKPLKPIWPPRRGKHLRPKKPVTPHANIRTSYLNLDDSMTGVTIYKIRDNLFPGVDDFDATINHRRFTPFGIQSNFLGVTNPYWRNQVRHGESATTPASGVLYSDSTEYLTFGGHQEYNNARDNWSVDVSTGGYDRLNNGGNASLVVSPSISDDVTARAISDLLNDAKSKMSAFEAGQDLGELRETIHSCLHPMQSIRDHVLGYFDVLQKKRRGRRKVSLPKALSDTYLEFRFGWNPLASDVADAIAKIPFNRPSVQAIHGKAHRVVDSNSSDSLPLPMDGEGTIRTSYNWKSTSKFSVKYMGAIWTRADHGAGRIPLAQSLQVLPRDWLPTAWDLIPYSWIADYFTNIGDIINAACFPSSLMAWCACTSVTQYVSQRTVAEQAFGFTEPPFVTDYKTKYFCYGGNRRVSEKRFTRSPINPLDLMPPLRIRIPVSSRPWENMGALMLSRSRSLTPFF
jgi:hypothetical protein